MRDNAILMVMPYEQYVRKAGEAGFEVHSIWDPSYMPEEYVAKVGSIAKTQTLLDFTDEDRLRSTVRELARRHDVAHVLHLGKESTQTIVCEEAQRLGLALNRPESLTLVNDKAETRKLLARIGLSPVRCVAFDRAEDVRTEFPAIVKPTRLDGSRFVRLVTNDDELTAWKRAYQGPALAEEPLLGPEFSVEVLTVRGQHHVIGVTAKELLPPPGFVEAGHLHPATLPDHHRAAMIEMVTKFLDATGYTFGPTHTEVILTGDGPRIVESQTRIGGDLIQLCIEIATGFDVESAVFTALLGKPVEIGPATRTGRVAFFRFPPGVLDRVDGLDEIRALEFVRELRFPFEPGQELPEPKDSSTRHGLVVVSAADPEEAQRHIDEVRGLLKVRVDGKDETWTNTGPISSSGAPSWTEAANGDE
ncbi:ATP-grasp domain-containing protein [Lentzea nigeriaca]|uniref:ATP-grasp domain-containing protein n=1 Tax=Lentzea nigeriaca TaxID=1128665 RepID=UPI00195E97BE|nr:ATP-grasp domain-containing protein [Lentzea nigeriaca]MBM7856327.1 hypothetical protein [Lentzea nigeriaca]